MGKRSKKKELLDNAETLPKQDIIQNLQEFEKINHWLGVKYSLRKGLNIIYKRNYYKFKSKTISFVDLGCGAGDLTRTIYYWALKRNIKFKVTGIDRNPDIFQYAPEIK